MPAVPTRIIHIEIDCSPEKRNAFGTFGIDVPPEMVINPKDDTVTITNTNNIALPILTPNNIIRYEIT